MNTLFEGYSTRVGISVGQLPKRKSAKSKVLHILYFVSTAKLSSINKRKDIVLCY